jgi:hypothetical protein
MGYLFSFPLVCHAIAGGPAIFKGSTPYTLPLAVLLCGVPETLVAFWGAL